jgi:protein phosphatase
MKRGRLIQYMLTRRLGGRTYLTRIGLSSDVGKSRCIDEDSVLSIEINSLSESQTRKRILLLIADGMGGHNKGEVASRVAGQVVATRIIKTLMSPSKIEPNSYHTELTEAIKAANTEILNYATTNADCEGMGTTISIAVIDSNQLHIAHVGDSRIYVINKDEIRQITRDHSYVQELIDQKRITPEEAKNHPQKNVITRVVGYYSEIKADVSSLLINADDFVLLCCDGLPNHVEDEEIKRILLRNPDPQKACDELIALANSRGGTDNISVIIASAKNARRDDPY